MMDNTHAKTFPQALLLLAAVILPLTAGCGGGGGGGEGGLVLPFCYPKHYKKACYNNDVYWYDSCGGREDMYQDCAANETCSGGQCVRTIWAKTFGGGGGDTSSSIKQTTDGGYIVAGSTGSYGAGDNDVWVIKLDRSGNTEWTKTFGGEDSDYALSIEQTSDGGYIIAGTTRSYGAGESDVWVLKLDSSGNQLWAKTFGGEETDYATSIRQTSDGGYIVAGNKFFGMGDSDAWILRLDSSGNQIWAKIFGGTEYDKVESIQQTSDGGYVAAGRTGSFSEDSQDFWVLKLDSEGQQVWSNTFGGSPLGDYAFFVQQTSDGGYVTVGNTLSYGEGQADVWVVKLDASGSQEWAKTFGGARWDSGRYVQQTSDGGYIVAGDTDTYSSAEFDDDLLLLKLDSSGNQTWMKTYGEEQGEGASCVRQTSDGGYIVAGGTGSYGAGSGDAWVLKLDSNGDCPGCFD